MGGCERLPPSKNVRSVLGIDEVLKIDEESFAGYVREITRRALTIYRVLDRRKRLKEKAIALGTIKPEQIRREYEIYVEIPYCQEQYSDSRGTIIAYTAFVLFGFGYGCLAKARYHDETDDETLDDFNYRRETVDAAYINIRNMEVMARPSMLYELYKFFYKELGVGARPLLDLARKAEEEGDKEVASVLTNLYAILETTKDIVREIEQADYSSVKIEIDEDEVEEKVEEALWILRRAKWLAEHGSLADLIDLKTSPFALSPIHQASTSKLIYGEIRLGYSRGELEEMMKEADIYNALITIAESLGLEVRFQEPLEFEEEEDDP